MLNEVRAVARASEERARASEALLLQLLPAAGKDQATPCAECHTVNGQGMVGIPDIAGLPASYLLAW